MSDAIEGVVRAAIVAAVPADEECLADEKACFARHPVHAAAWRGDQLVSVYAEVDGLVRVVVDALEKAEQWRRVTVRRSLPERSR